MKKSTLFLLVAAAVLAAVAFFVTKKGGKEAPKKLDIAGYATEAELAAEKKLGMMDTRPTIKHPIDEVVLERADGTITLAREGEGEDAKWKLTSPVQAPAVKYQVEQIIELFKSPTTRMDARAIKEKDLPLFDLEPGRRIGLTLKSKGAVWNGVDLIVGQVVKEGEPGEGEAVKGTWVLVKGDETTAFLIADKDLRTPADKALTDLRDKKVFDFDAEALSRIEIAPPSGDKVVLVGETKETPPAPDAGPDAKPTRSTTWTLTEPAGVKGDAGISSVARNLANLRVTEFVPLAKATEDAKKALAGATWKVAMKAGDKDVVLVIAEGAKEPIWGQVEGKDEVFSLPAYSANNVRKGLEELEDKTVWDLSADAVTALTLKGDSAPITVVKGAAGWQFTSPAVAFPADPSGALASVAKLTAVRWAKKDEVAEARAALSTPDIAATLAVGETVYALAISAPMKGDESGSNNRWAVVGDVASAKPFVLADYNAKRFATTVDALRHKKLLPKGKDDIAAVTIQLAGSAESATLEKPSTGGDLTVLAPPEGKVGNDETIRTIVSTLGALEAKGFHDGKAVDATGLDPQKCTRVSIRGADGTTATLLISATNAEEGSPYAMIDQGPLANIPVAINEYQAKNLAKRPDELLQDAPAPAPAPAVEPAPTPPPNP